MKLNNIKVGTRLAAGFALVVLFLIGITGLGQTRMSMLDDSTTLIVKDRYPKVALSNQVLEGISDTAIRMRNLLIDIDPEHQRRELEQIAASRQRVDGYIKELDRLLSTPKGRAILGELNAARSRYRQTQDQYFSLLQGGDKAAAASLLLGQLAVEQQEYFERVRGLVALGGKLMEASGVEAHAISTSSATLMTVLAGAAVLVAALCA